ncbi:Response regulator receiver domain-containing protein [Tistlia consotensis]|uniref:Response regulator receiver domain-containing protein n=1 Tax=Tistlia consotensis USBA 355 TaxID=560819 RepID=A0A1Y6BJA2_9PROT|nr:response regulator [Tistlia consotensis]SMF03795.1 Response regulator receiver domain-containing protein [Tistlia consotensis USBA 355]SNR54048.1 Response regulator receiver domain-containing protein [Tistlia consotensis]
MTAHPLVAIVDDDESARAALLGLVRALGFEACAFPSASTFLASEEGRRTACLLADLRMPGMGGVELLHALAASGRPTPAIVVTAFPDETTRRHALAAGAVAYLVKPLAPDALLDGIRSALAGRGLAP